MGKCFTENKKIKVQFLFRSFRKEKYLMYYKLRHGLNVKSGHNNKGNISVRHKQRGHKKNYYLHGNLKHFLNTYNTLVHSGKYNVYYNSKGVLHLQKKNQITINSKIPLYRKYVVSYKYNWAYTAVGNAYCIGSLKKNTTLNKLYQDSTNVGTSTGSSIKILYQHSFRFTAARLPSGQKKLIESCSIGLLGKESFLKRKLKKAGESRWIGKRPSVRGVAMNPVDHPHGGGEGKRKGRISVSKWGKHTKGMKTSKYKNKWILNV